MTTVIHYEEIARMGQSEQMRRKLDEIGSSTAERAKQHARVLTGRLRDDIGYVVSEDAYGAYVDIYTAAARRGFRYGAYWNAIDQYLDHALRE